MTDLKIPVALVFAMAVQLVGLVWYISSIVHDIEHLKQTVSAQDELIRLIDQDVNDLWALYFYGKQVGRSYSDMVYERLCGTKEVVNE